jgi:hypothetical protein
MILSRIDFTLPNQSRKKIDLSYSNLFPLYLPAQQACSHDVIWQCFVLRFWSWIYNFHLETMNEWELCSLYTLNIKAAMQILGRESREE